MEIATTIINKSFSYSFFTIGKVLSNLIYNTINSDHFTYIVNNQYPFNKFYKIMINTNVSKYSITNYE